MNNKCKWITVVVAVFDLILSILTVSGITMFIIQYTEVNMHDGALYKRILVNNPEVADKFKEHWWAYRVLNATAIPLVLLEVGISVVLLLATESNANVTTSYDMARIWKCFNILKIMRDLFVLLVFSQYWIGFYVIPVRVVFCCIVLLFMKEAGRNAMISDYI